MYCVPQITKAVVYLDPEEFHTTWCDIIHLSVQPIESSDSDYAAGLATRQSTVPEWQWLPEGSLSFWLQVDFSCTNYVQVPTQCGFVLFRR